MSKSQLFVSVAVSYMGGVLLGSLVSLEKPWLLLALAFFILVFVLGEKFWRNCAVVLCFFVLGFLSITSHLSSLSQYSSWYGEKQDFEAVVVEDIDVRTDKQLLTIKPDGLSQNILVTTTKFGEYFYGDRVWIRGKVTEPTSFSDFDYRGYLEMKRVYAVMRYPKIVVLKTGGGNFLKRNILKLKTWATKEIGRKTTEPEASLLLGILIGAKKTLPQNVLDNFSITGITHIIAVSGFNVSIIVLALSYLSRFFGRKLSLWLSLAVIAGFVVMAGGGSSIVRAGIMGVLFLLSLNIGRLYAIGPSLALAAGVMVFLNPMILYWDVGFQLSFAATLGIVYLFPVLKSAFLNTPEVFGLKDVFLVTLSATIATLPFILFNFERFSTVGLLANVLVVPIVPLVMLLGAGILLPFVGSGFAFITTFLLAYILKVSEVLAGFSFSSIELSVSPLTFASMLAAVFCLYIILYSKAKEKGSLVPGFNFRNPKV